MFDFLIVISGAHGKRNKPSGPKPIQVYRKCRARSCRGYDLKIDHGWKFLVFSPEIERLYPPLAELAFCRDFPKVKNPEILGVFIFRSRSPGYWDFAIEILR